MNRWAMFVLATCACWSPAFAVNVEFGWHPGSHGTAGAIGTLTHANVGWLNKGLVYWACPGDVLDSIGLYAASGDGNAESLRVYIYTLTGDLGTLGTRALMDTVGPITNAAGEFKWDFNYTFTEKTYYTLAVDTFTATGGGLVNRYVTTTGTAATMVPQTAGEDMETKTAPGASPWGTEGTNVVSFMEMWGVVTINPATGTRRPVEYISDWDTTSITVTNDTLIGRKPASMADGDVLVALIMKGDDLVGSTLTEPTDWRVLHEASSTAGDDQMVGAYYKVIVNAAGEPSTYPFAFSAAETFAGGIICLRNVDTNAIMDCSPFTNYNLDVTNNDPICRAITTRTDSCAVIVMATSSLTDTGTVTVPSGFTTNWAWKAGNNTTAFNACFAAYKIQNVAGTTGDATWGVNDITATDAHTITLAFRPKEASTPLTSGPRRRSLLGGSNR